MKTSFGLFVLVETFWILYMLATRQELAKSPKSFPFPVSEEFNNLELEGIIKEKTTQT